MFRVNWLKYYDDCLKYRKKYRNWEHLLNMLIHFRYKIVYAGIVLCFFFEMTLLQLTLGRYCDTTFRVHSAQPEFKVKIGLLTLALRTADWIIRLNLDFVKSYDYMERGE